MAILTTLLILIIACFLLAHTKFVYRVLNPLDSLLLFVSVISACIFVVAIAFVPLNRMIVHSDLAEFKAVYITAEQGRSQNRLLEGVQWRLKVSGQNQWLASMKYWNSTVFDIWIPDEIEAVEFIQ